MPFAHTVFPLSSAARPGVETGHLWPEGRGDIGPPLSNINGLPATSSPEVTHPGENEYEIVLSSRCRQQPSSRRGGAQSGQCRCQAFGDVAQVLHARIAQCGREWSVESDDMPGR